jgi:uncharacterized membrane protein YvlD (DUF360 family)
VGGVWVEGVILMEVRLIVLGIVRVRVRAIVIVIVGVKVTVITVGLAETVKYREKEKVN